MSVEFEEYQINPQIRTDREMKSNKGGFITKLFMKAGISDENIAKKIMAIIAVLFIALAIGIYYKNYKADQTKNVDMVKLYKSIKAGN